MRNQVEWTKRDLKRLLRDRESRRLQVDIRWDRSQERYISVFFREGQVLLSRTSKKYQKGQASVGIDSVDDKLPRVPWKQIDAGITWSVSAIISDYFWEQYCEVVSPPSSKIINLDTFRRLNST